MLYNKMIDVGSDLSPESAYVPYESLNDRQMAITGECFPEHSFYAYNETYHNITVGINELTSKITCYDATMSKTLDPTIYAEY